MIIKLEKKNVINRELTWSLFISFVLHLFFLFFLIYYEDTPRRPDFVKAELWSSLPPENNSKNEIDNLQTQPKNPKIKTQESKPFDKPKSNKLINDNQISLEKKKREKEKLAKEKAKKEKLAKEKAEKEKLAKEKAKKEKLAKEKAKKEKLAKEKAKKEKLAKEKAKKEKLAKEK
ncbi:MAG: hypothetical protein CBD16_00280, partial [Betaproteobacteria bacterium TMED156]